MEKNRSKSRLFGGSGVHDHPADGYSVGVGGGSCGSDLGIGFVDWAVAAAGTGGAGVTGTARFAVRCGQAARLGGPSARGTDISE